MSQKTAAHRRYKDDVPEHVKKLRHNRMIELYRRKCQRLNEAEIGTTHLVLVEGTAKKTGQIMGRNEFYTKVVFNQTSLPDNEGTREVRNGDYVAVKITSAKSSVLNGIPLYRTTLTEFYRNNSWADRWRHSDRVGSIIC